MKISINKKLAGGFGFCVLLMTVVVVFGFAALRKLEKLHLETVKRSVDAELATDAQHIGEDIYMIIANAVINRDMSRSAQLWADGKKECLEKLRQVAVVADNREELAKVREAREALNYIIRTYEGELLPLILKGAAVPGPLADIDARIDRKVETIDLALQSVARSMSEENQRATGEFHAVLLSTFGFGLAVSLVGVVFAITVSTLTTRSIVRPLTEMTLAAQEMENGNHLIELKHRSDDEIGILARAFGNMAEQVAKRTAELQGANERLAREVRVRTLAEEEVWILNTRLEHLVVERTAELLNANMELKDLLVVHEEAEKELERSRGDLRNLSQHLQDLREEDRVNVAREVHDELGQLLTVLKMDVCWLGDRLNADQRRLLKKAQEMELHIDETIKTVQRISTELRPGVLDDLGLAAAIRWQAREFQKRTGIICEVESSPDFGSLDRGRSTALFRIFQETLTNIYRHAGATQARVTLESRDDEIIATVTDNGRGINPEQISDPRSLGLIGMRERVHYFGGAVEIGSPPEGGTRVRVIIPLGDKVKEKPYDTNFDCR